MKCPKCENEMEVTNTYQAGCAGRTQRLYCGKCHIEATAFIATILVNTTPSYGEGAKALAKKIADLSPAEAVKTLK